MVKAVKKGNKSYFICEACGFAYSARELSEKCQEFCEKHNSCSLEITRHAVRI